MLAVNGPPGTGKTTLLRSVVANLWTQAALDEAEPPLIVAASNNNQAVTNILESFAKVDEAGLDERLMGRWLPEVASYGLYCCASDRANDQNPYLYYGPRGEGCMQAWQTREYFERARHHFLQHAGQWQDGSATDLQEVRKALHQAMMQRRREMVSGLESLGDFQAVEQEVMAASGDLDALQAAIEATREQQGATKAQHKRLESQLDELYALWERRSLWVLHTVARASHRCIPASAGTSQDGPAVEPVGLDPGRSHGCCCGRLVREQLARSRETTREPDASARRSAGARRTISNLRGRRWTPGSPVTAPKRCTRTCPPSRSTIRTVSCGLSCLSWRPTTGRHAGWWSSMTS